MGERVGFRGSDQEISIPKPPELFTVIDEIEVGERVDLFFNQLLDFLGYDDKARMAFVERRSFANLDSIGKDGSVRPSDEHLELLVVRDRMVASVVMMRDDFNRCQVGSACYLTPEIVRLLQAGVVNK